jgi:RNAse (barnase) inhibitor barstar
MAIFRDEPEDFQRLDWTLLQNGAITLYLRAEFLAEDTEWLESHNYRIDRFDCSAWASEKEMHEALAAGLEFPDYYGRNLDALNDCLSDIEIPEESGRVLIFHRYDAFAAKCPRAAWVVLDIIESNSRSLLLFGRRLLALVQSNDPSISFERVGARPVMWNQREWLNKSRGL